MKRIIAIISLVVVASLLSCNVSAESLSLATSSASKVQAQKASSTKDKLEFIYKHWGKDFAVFMGECQFDTSNGDVVQSLAAGALLGINPEYISDWIIVYINGSNIQLSSSVLASSSAYNNLSSSEILSTCRLGSMVFHGLSLSGQELDWDVIDDNHISVNGNSVEVNGEGFLFSLFAPVIKPTYLKVLRKDLDSAQLGLISSMFSSGSNPNKMMASMGFTSPDLKKHYTLTAKQIEEIKEESSRLENEQTEGIISKINDLKSSVDENSKEAKLQSNYVGLCAGQAKTSRANVENAEYENVSNCFSDLDNVVKRASTYAEASQKAADKAIDFAEQAKKLSPDNNEESAKILNEIEKESKEAVSASDEAQIAYQKCTEELKLAKEAMIRIINAEQAAIKSATLVDNSSMLYMVKPKSYIYSNENFTSSDPSIVKVNTESESPYAKAMTDGLAELTFNSSGNKVYVFVNSKEEFGPLLGGRDPQSAFDDFFTSALNEAIESKNLKLKKSDYGQNFKLSFTLTSTGKIEGLTILIDKSLKKELSEDLINYVGNFVSYSAEAKFWLVKYVDWKPVDSVVTISYQMPQIGN